MTSAAQRIRQYLGSSSCQLRMFLHTVGPHIGRPRLAQPASKNDTRSSSLLDPTEVAGELRARTFPFFLLKFFFVKKVSF